MKICIVGAGSIGGYLGARLIHAGEQVTLIARGANLAAIRERGMTLIETDGATITARPALATDDPSDAGPHDVVIIAVKAHQLPAVAPLLRPLFHDTTIVVPAQNGIPWWYFQRHGGPLRGTTHRIGRSRRNHCSQYRNRTDHWLCRLPGDRTGSAGGCSPHRGRSVYAWRT
jgi:2-dehydropantoate 2-reductase